jgi:hypothetical protein
MCMLHTDCVILMLLGPKIFEACCYSMQFLRKWEYNNNSHVKYHRLQWKPQESDRIQAVFCYAFIVFYSLQEK